VGAPAIDSSSALSPQQWTSNDGRPGAPVVVPVPPAPSTEESPKAGVGGAPTYFDEQTAKTKGPSQATPHVLTGTHWAGPADFPALKKAGYDFAVVTVDPNNKAQLNSMLDAAHANGLKLIVGAQPYPYVHSGNDLQITPAGTQFLKNLAERQEDVMGVFVFNEPFWTDPLTNRTSNKGVYTAKQLGDLNDKIKSTFPGAKIYQDIGAPSAWAPGGALGTGDKYPLDQLKRVADYWGIFGNGAEPFTAGGGYNKDKALQEIEAQVKFVREKLGGEAIVAAQSYRAPRAGITGYPSDAQIQDFNCALRKQIPDLAGISWYVYRQAPLYQDFLANHPEQVPLTGPLACPGDVEGSH
jgi:hypothetical protein